MTRPTPTRRRLLQSGAAIGASALAGCFDGGAGDSGPVGADQPLSVVPGDARFAVALDASALLSDQALRSSLNDFLSEANAAAGAMPAGPASVEDGLDRIEESAGLDPRDVSAATGFGGYELGATAGAVVWTDWSTDEVREALADQAETVESGEYGGRTVLEPSGSGVVGALGDGAFAVGDRPGVEAVVDVTTGDADAVDGTVRTGFEATDGGAIRLAFDAPDDLGEGSATEGGVDPAVFRPVTHGYGAYEIDGSDRRAYLTVETESAAAAGDLQSALETLLSQARQQMQEASDQQPMVAEMRSVLEATSVSSDDANVTLSAGNAEVLPLLFVAVLSSFALGLGSSQQPVAPQVMFEFEYDVDAGIVTVTHQGGDNVPASELHVRGQGIASSSGADMASPGPWAGSTSTEQGGQPAVAAGDSVTVGVAGPAYELRVVWESADGATSATLAMDRGPEA